MKKTITSIVSLITVLVVILYGYEFILKKPLLESPTVTEEIDSYMPTTEIKEQYEDSIYTFVGTVQVPSPCHTIKTKVNAVSDNTYQIVIATIAPPENTICAQVLTDKQYKVSFEAGENITVTARIDGVEYRTNRFVIPLDQNIETFNLEIKG